jgi:aryl-alcohol dehydrogenase-like predicted oxidoreductase/enamine deaminase RidA (YjgF/YER057c/UK114 family)
VPVDRCDLAPGLSIARVVNGLWQIADMERDGQVLDVETTADAMQAYVDAGLTTFDMADHYGSAEVVAGCYNKRVNAGRVQLLTKWVPEPGPVTPAQVRRAVERALTRLQVEQLPLLQFHAWHYASPSWLDALFELDRLRDQGLVQHLGLTNFDTAHLRMALSTGIRVVSNQVCFSLLDRRATGPMSALCLERGVKLLAFGTVAGGLLSERWLGVRAPESLETWSQMKYRRFIDAAGGWDRYQELLTVLHRQANRLGVSIANVACRAILDEPAVGAIIVGARLGRSEHIAETRRLFEFALDDAARRDLAAAADTLHSIDGDCGDEYRKPPFLTASGDLSHHLSSIPAPYIVKASDRVRVFTGTVWEDLCGFARAVRDGHRVLISGTTATHGSRDIGGDDVVAQTHFILDKIEGVLHSLGAPLSAVVRTRIYVRREGDWEAVSRAHGERFRTIQPANTLLRADPIGEQYLVEIEAEASV